jgi:hypothetical protein
MRCPGCNSLALILKCDQTTNRPVVADGKVIVQCVKCGEVFIASEAGWDAHLGRSPVRTHLRTLLAAGGVFVALLLAGLDWLTGFWLPWRIALLFAGGFALLSLFEVVLQRSLLARGRALDDNDAAGLVGIALMVILGIAFVALLIWQVGHAPPRGP